MASSASIILRPEHCDPLFLLRELGKDHAFVALLESADRAHGTNDFSFLALGANDVIEVRNGTVRRTGKKPEPVTDPLIPFESIIRQSNEGGRLRMGYIGFLSYEAAGTFEAIDLPRADVPDGLFFLPEVVIRMDHRKREVTLIARDDTKLDIGKIKEVILQSPFFDDSVSNI